MKFQISHYTRSPIIYNNFQRCNELYSFHKYRHMRSRHSQSFILWAHFPGAYPVYLISYSPALPSSLPRPQATTLAKYLSIFPNDERVDRLDRGVAPDWLRLAAVSSHPHPHTSSHTPSTPRPPATAHNTLYPHLAHSSLWPFPTHGNSSGPHASVVFCDSPPGWLWNVSANKVLSLPTPPPRPWQSMLPLKRTRGHEPRKRAWIVRQST